MDATIDDSSSDVTLETRSLLYRALTRAQMMVLVVDQFLSYGYLAFLSRLSLREDAVFDAKEALAQQNARNAMAPRALAHRAYSPFVPGTRRRRSFGTVPNVLLVSCMMRMHRKDFLEA